MAKLDLNSLEIEYKSLKPKFNRLKDSIIIQVEELLELENIPLGFPIQNRTKSWDSIVNKVESKRFNIKSSITELQDIVGLRVILLFNKDVENVCKLIEDNLTKIKRYNTSEKLLDNQFGYASEHFVVKIPEAWISVPTFKDLGGLVAEIQVRTLSQHTWAEASKQLQYKQEENIPRELFRSIGRVSALLETVDLELDRLLDQREKYKNLLSSNLSTAINQTLNVDILESLLNEKLPPDNKAYFENYSELIEDLRIFNINTSEELEKLINDYLMIALESDEEFVNSNSYNDEDGEDMERATRGVFLSHVGLIREMLDKRDPEKWLDFNMSRR
ncbi:GTP pyrophosphokinase [Flavobacterium gyeonganense]|uniref:GTP pyrophosphokinase family protein n=1 Tax=Flavobacterium gyeonganense TaxID=1310418 RepID=A0ABV5HFJ6_9FLAO|nr:hypothetical protein [Flavobacterium gyeonganense]